MSRLKALIGGVLVVVSLLLLRFFQLSEADLFWVGLMGVGVLLFVIGLRWVLDNVGLFRAYCDMWPILSLGMVIAWLIHSVGLEDLVAGSWLGQEFGSLTVITTTLLLGVWRVKAVAMGNVLVLAAPSQVSGVEVTALCGGFLSVLMFIGAFSFVLFDVGRILGGLRLLMLFLLGIVVTAAAAMLRVFIVVLAGFYWGFDVMMLAHTYVGYSLFLVVVCGFWYGSIEWSKRLREVLKGRMSAEAVGSLTKTEQDSSL